MSASDTRTWSRWVASPGSVTGGGFRYVPATDTWWWSDELYRLFGYEPGEVVPTTDLLLWHHAASGKSDEDTLEAVARAASGAAPIQVQVMRDARGRDMAVLVLTEHETGTGPDGEPVAVARGAVVDLTETIGRGASGAATEHIERWARANEGIEQAKGALRFAYRVDDDAAFALLRRASNLSNTRVRALAEQVLAAPVGAASMHEARARLDRLLVLDPSAGRAA